MNTPDFSQFKKEPPPEFADALYQKIATEHSFLFRTRAILNRPVSTARAALILIVSVLIVGTCARQIYTPRQVQVGSFWVHEMSEEFICAGDTVYPSYTPSSPMPTPQPAPTNVPTVSLQELKQMLDFPLRIPSWAPEGFSLQQEEYPIPSPFVYYSISWIGPNNTGINMMYFPEIFWPSGQEIRVLRGAWEETKVRNVPAVVVHGQCRFIGNPQSVQAYENLEMAWDDNVTRLYWDQEGVYYELFGSDIDADTLIRMAEAAR